MFISGVHGTTRVLLTTMRMMMIMRIDIGVHWQARVSVLRSDGILEQNRKCKVRKGTDES